MDPNFHRAAQSGNWEAIQEFPAEFCNQRTASGNTILHVLIQYCDSSADAVKHILTQKPDLAFLKTKDDETPLIIASRRGNLDVVRALIDCVKGYEDGGRRTSGAKRVAKMLLAVANNGNTAFHEAVINNFYDIAEFLVKEDPKIIYGRNNADESPFYIAVKKGYHRIASLILSTCKVYSYDGPDEKTPLHAAAVKNSPETISLLVGLSMCEEMQINKVAVRCDSRILIDTVNEKARASWRIRPLIKKISRYKYFVTEFTHCFREGNCVADTLAKEAQIHRQSKFFTTVGQTSKQVRTLIHMDSWNICNFRLIKRS